MISGKGIAASALIAAIASLACGAANSDWIGSGVAVFAVVFSAVALMKCGSRASMFCLAGSLLSLIGNCIIWQVIPESVIDDGTVSRATWNFLCAILHVLPLPALSIAAFYVIAASFDSSFNWALTCGLCPFVGLGILVPGFVIEYFDELMGAPELPSNAYAVDALLVGLVVMAITGFVVKKVMKPNRYLIRASGREVRQE